MKKVFTLAVLLVGCSDYGPLDYCATLDPEATYTEGQTVELLGVDCMGSAISPNTILTDLGCEADVVLWQGEDFDVVDSYEVAWADGQLGHEPVALMLFTEHPLPNAKWVQIYDPPAGGYGPDMLEKCLRVVDANGFPFGVESWRKTTLTGGECEDALPGSPLYAIVEGHRYVPNRDTLLAGIQSGGQCNTHTAIVNVLPVIRSNQR